MLKELASKIAEETGWAIGSGLFAGFRPEDAPDDCVTILESSTERQSFMVPSRFEKAVQFLCRARDHHVARAFAVAVRDAISGRRNAALTLPALVSGGPIYQIDTAVVISGPAWLGLDDKKRHLFTLNLLMHYQSA